MVNKCEECDKTFSSKFNLERHNYRFHTESDLSDEERTDSENQESDEEVEEDGSTKSEDSSDNSNDDDDKEAGFERIIDDAKSQLQSELEDAPEENAEKRKKRLQKKTLRIALKKIFRETYKDTLLWMRGLKKNPTHVKVMNTAKSLREEDEYGYDESIESAISLRKHLLNRVVPDFEDVMDQN